LKLHKLDDFIGKLLTYEIHLQEEIEEQAPQQGLKLNSNSIGKQVEESKTHEDE